MLAINYLMMGNLDEAQVETRKLNDKLYKFRYEGRKLRSKSLAFYLSAMIEEANKDWDSAYIDFKKAYDLNPNLEYLHEDLIRAGIAARRGEESRVEEKMAGREAREFQRSRRSGACVPTGLGTAKAPDPGFPRIPKLYPVYSSTQRARLDVEGEAPANTETVASVTMSQSRPWTTTTRSDRHAGRRHWRQKPWSPIKFAKRMNCSGQSPGLA